MADVFDGVFGQPQVREFLRAVVEQDKVSHAYLFCGPAGSNKTAAAYALAQAAVCQHGTGCEAQVGHRVVLVALGKGPLM